MQWDVRGRGENLDIHQVIHTDASKLRELLSALLQELGNSVTLLTLVMMGVIDNLVRGVIMNTYHDTLSVTTSVPVGIRDFNILILEFLLLPQPLLAQVFTFLPLHFLSFSIGQERRIDGGVLPQLGLLCWFPIFVHSGAGCG